MSENSVACLSAGTARGSSEDQVPDPEREPHPKREMVGLSGLEPLTSRLSGGRSNQLSYRPEDLTCLVLQCVSAVVRQTARLSSAELMLDGKGDPTNLGASFLCCATSVLRLFRRASGASNMIR